MTGGDNSQFSLVTSNGYCEGVLAPPDRGTSLELFPSHLSHIPLQLESFHGVLPPSPSGISLPIIYIHQLISFLHTNVQLSLRFTASMELHLLPILTCLSVRLRFYLSFVFIFLTTQKQGDASPIAGYDAVYGSTQKQRDASPIAGYDAVYGSTQKQGDASPIAGYDAVYGSTKKQGDASPIAGYDAVYGSTKKQGNASPIAGYDAVYGSTRKQGDASPIAGYAAVYGSTKKQGDASPISGYDAVYGTSQKAEGSSINVHKDASSIAGYDAVYGTPKKAIESSTKAHKDASQIAGYDAVYGNSQQKAGGSSINAHKDSSPVASYGAVNVFLEKDLHPGTKMAVRFTKTSSAAHFLPHQVAESIPFSSNKLPEILKRFSVKENSAEAQMIQKTIKQCETPAIVGEVKYCARSLESLIDFSTSRLGKNIRVLSNEVEADIQEYKFGEGVKMVGEKSVVCHQLNYPYAVAFCHTLHMTKIYMVPSVGADGTGVEAVAVCHRDTSTWDPKALVFQRLKVKPGTLPICHFLPNGHIVWVPKFNGVSSPSHSDFFLGDWWWSAMLILYLPRLIGSRLCLTLPSRKLCGIS
uniref:BURP domain-containing protein n=1 Tax=Vitis vinifera TaxID=29760 RepID=F6H302_VITVI